VEAVKKRGRSDVGAKTMLDVLAPALDSLRATAARPHQERLAELRRAVDLAYEATREMQATRGRASFLGERSRGHLDPGACSTRLLAHAACDVLEHHA
jgi:phosphoenolpyruvate---glycerone phosphotransferase subunit DhaL